MTPHTPATILSVAERAGVSKSLASRALRGDPGVSDENRARILRAAAELGYRPNVAARSLVRGRSGIIGVVLNDIGNPHHTEVVAGVEAAAREHDQRVIIGHGAQSASVLTHQLDTMLELRVDGVVVVSSWVPPAVLTRAGREVPLVVVARVDEPDDGYDVVASDDEEGARAAVAHLWAGGRRRLAYLTRSLSATSEARVRGVVAAGGAVGADIAVHRLRAGDDRALREVVIGGRYDGIVAHNDVAAAEVLRLAHENGVRVPDDLALIGYDDSSIARVVSPPLTSVGQPQRRMGRLAVDAIQERMAGRTTPLRALFPPALVVRGSSG